MPKDNYISRLQAQKAIEMKLQRKFTMQWCADAAVMAANEVFKRKGKIISEFLVAFFKYSTMIAEMTLDDAKSDKRIEYTKTKVDNQLREILGDDFQPWEERYDFFKE